MSPMDWAPRAGQRLARWWWTPVSARALGFVRTLVAGFALAHLLIRAPAILGCIQQPESRFAPVGIIYWLHTEPAHPVILVAAWLMALLACPAMIWGWRVRVSGLLAALASLWVLSYRNSWGMVFHTENLLVFHLLILACAPVGARGAVRRRESSAEADEADEVSGRYGWPLRLMCIATVSSYFIAGQAKLVARGWEWAQGATLQRQIAYDNLRKIALGDIYSPLGVWILDFDWIFAPLAWATLVFELAAPLALLDARVGRIWVWGIWGFHVGVLLTMAILFAYPVSGVAFVAFFACRRGFESQAWVLRVQGLLSRFRR